MSHKRRYRSISKRVLYSDYRKQIRNIKLHKLLGQPLNIEKTRKEIVENKILIVGDYYAIQHNRLVKVTSRKKIVANIEEYSFRFNHANKKPKYYHIIDQEGTEYWTKASDYNDGKILKEKYIGNVMDLEPFCRLGTGKIKLRRGKWYFENEQGLFYPVKKKYEIINNIENKNK